MSNDKNATVVNVDNYVRAETAAQFDRFIAGAGGVNAWNHNRKPTALDKQNVIRMNRDTLYSFAVVDISEGATLTLPDAGKRYMTVMVVNEDEYIYKVFHSSGTYDLTADELGSKHVLLAGRTLADPTDAADIKIVNGLQDRMKIDAKSSKPYTHPDYDQASYKSTYTPILELSKGVTDTFHMFGRSTEVTETRHMLGAAFGWGGLPVYEAFYITENEPRPAGSYQLKVKDVPVDGFWSISIYNKDGYFEENQYNSYSLNDLTAKAGDDGSFTVNFAEKPDGLENCLHVMDGWNYVVRLYRPRKEILDGTWTFPEPQPTN
jgi:hypothetical protein